MRSVVRHLSILSGLWVLLSAVSATPVLAQDQAFIYTVNTSAPETLHQRWNVRYDAGYGNHSTDPLGFDGMEQGLAFQGPLGHGFTARGHVALGLADQSTSSSQEVEVLKDLRSASRGLGLAAGLGMRREWEGTSVLFGRVAAGHNFKTSMLFGNVSFERAFEQTRDGVDVITSIGWLRRVGSAVHVGAEALGEDLEGLWDPNEAEGGAKIFAGPSVHVAIPAHSWSLTVCAGPIFYPSRNGRTSPAGRPLDARGNGFSARMSFGYSF